MEVQSTVEGAGRDADKADAEAGVEDNECSGVCWSGAWSGRSNKSVPAEGTHRRRRPRRPPVLPESPFLFLPAWYDSL